MKTCRDGGWLVGVEHRYPQDRKEHYSGGEPVVGCNNLRCEQCEAEIRTAAGFRLVLGDTPTEIVHHRVELATLLTPSRGTRQYLCRCDSYAATTPVPAANALRRWRCAGHR